MKVLLTRPQGRNQAMLAALQNKGVQSLVTPLLSIASYQDSVDTNSIALADIIIFISTNAVEFAFQQASFKWPTNARYFAVGQATYDALKHKGITAKQTPQANQTTEGLLALPDLQNIDQLDVVIVRGMGGRECLAHQLTQLGAKVTYWQVYQRILPPQLNPDSCQQWRDLGIDTIVVTSGEILNNLIQLVTPPHQAWLQTCQIIVPSQRVAQIAQAAGINNVINANGANTVSVMEALGLDL